MIRQENHDSTEWKPLPPGSLTNFARRERSRRRRKRLTLVGTPVAVLVLLVLVSLRLSESPQLLQPAFGDIACVEVASHMKAFSDGSLDQSLMETIRDHLSECPACRQKMESMKKLQSVTSRNEPQDTINESSSTHSQFLVASVK